jgi:hypothetical protein
VGEREPPRLVHPRGALVDHPLAEHDVAEQAALLGQPDLGAVGELARLAEVVHERGGEQEVGVQTRMQHAGLDHERPHRDGVLEQAAEVGVVAAARARGAAPLGAQGVVREQALQQPRVRRVVHLARQVLEEAVELVDVAVRDRQELRGISGVGPCDVEHLDLQLVAEALHAPAHADELAAVEAAGQDVGVLERAAGQRAGAIAQLEREVGRAGPGEQPVLARARVDAGDLVSRPQ